MSQTKCTIITVGEEIVSGLITDSNSAWLAKQMYALGIEVQDIHSVKDEKEEIIQAVERAFSKSDLIFMTGGLGPTKDDLTKTALNEYFNCNMRYDERTYLRLEKLITKFGRQPTEAHKEQCYMPEKATLLLNDMGTAPGMWFDENGKVLLSMPGVPYEMKHLISDRAIPLLYDRFELQPIYHRILMTAGMGESVLAKEIEDVESLLPEGISIAYLPGLGGVRIRISGRGEDAAAVREKVEIVLLAIEERIGQYVYGYDNMSLAAALGQLLKEKNATVSTAESCTGGRIAHEWTKTSGSSAYYDGSIITYSNKMKMQLLGVHEKTLNEHGAVSEQTVVEMVQGALSAMKTTYAMATSGIAGPMGGSPEKPVGTIWIACGNQDITITRKLQLSKDRLRNIDYTSTAALTLLRNLIIGRE